ncbi:type II toxin-antitoxin system VapC family toxin [Desulfococcaceae bacterium HSG8]|nr:type II toxin-antitoxin system VapC family toxin [Desulfococcaceae bacterium HSG8]
MLLDSNIIIYAIKPEFSGLREFISEHTPSVSVISYLEVLGYHQLTPEDKQDFKDFFDAVPMINLSQPILEQAVNLRQQRKMSLGDSIIGATAMVHSLTLVTVNVKDFRWIQGIEILNPLANEI